MDKEMNRLRDSKDNYRSNIAGKVVRIEEKYIERNKTMRKHKKIKRRIRSLKVKESK